MQNRYPLYTGRRTCTKSRNALEISRRKIIQSNGGVVLPIRRKIVEKLYEMGEVKYKNLFVDGTKIEAYANKYTFVWKKAVEKNIVKLNKKIEDILPVISERYGFGEIVTLEECYDALVRQAQWINLTFAVGKGKHKTQLQRDY